ncbi:nuclear transport factor 2 family protein [Nonomuraea sp. NPDC049421]|uniref:nuclear transport factor 2 family protein n=1 Tax=Nonomuraea sp. NPDC049421 TaxID=3155275 RepID=UPI0034374928
MERFDVIDTCVKMAWYADQRQWAELAEVFADQVTLDYTSLDGGEPATLTPAQIVGGWQAVLGGYAATQHLLSHPLVVVDGDTALCTAPFQATHRKSDDTSWTLGGTYRFELARTRSGWRITAVVMAAAWNDGVR